MLYHWNKQFEAAGIKFLAQGNTFIGQLIQSKLWHATSRLLDEYTNCWPMLLQHLTKLLMPQISMTGTRKVWLPVVQPEYIFSEWPRSEVNGKVTKVKLQGKGNQCYKYSLILLMRINSDPCTIFLAIVTIPRTIFEKMPKKKGSYSNQLC